MIGTFPQMVSHHVYAMFCQDGGGPGYVKFGRSMRIGQRLSELRTACPIPAKMFAIAAVPSYEFSKKVELGFHREFKDRRISGEWYKFDFSSEEDKKAFNLGCRYVFNRGLPQDQWWTKINVEELDDYNDSRRKLFLKSKHRREISDKARFKEQRRKAWRELEEYA